MFKKILIANRGEIACRVIRACRELGIPTVAVYSEPDRHSLHVRMADEAVLIGPAASSESYLRGDRIIEHSLRLGVDAIHPGYGFLSENAGFSRMVEQAGITFIGPPPGVMELMGGKISARKVAIEAGVPVVPGATEPVSSPSEAIETAREIGFPVMLKASAGGGGKGMRLVLSEIDFHSALETAQSEALASFGDSSVYIEKAVLKPRHIEIQVFSDRHGNHVHLGERECSIQRRHQKVIEECPSPINSEELRREMGEAAVKVARAVDYVGAGTVEFLVSDVDRSFYFLEMNTRLQVEHPVTEMVTGIDLVREQLSVAAGRPLSFGQDDVSWVGHAIECRIYAEDPSQNFMPSPGRITRLRVPQGSGIRDDGGVYEGSEVSIYYDPMISKFATFGATRVEAIERMRRALQEYHIGGIKTTIPFFREVMEDEEFLTGNVDTAFIPRFMERRLESESPSIISDMALIANAIAVSTALPKSGDGKNNSSESRWAESARTAAFKNRI